MGKRFDKPRRPHRYVTQARSFVRDYTEGLNVQDLKRLFDRDASKAYAVLARDQTTAQPEDGKKVGLGTRIGIVLRGVSSRLSPARRLLFALAIVTFLLAILSTVRVDFYSFAPLNFLLEIPTVWFLWCIAALFFLLTLELVDRVRVRDELEVARQLQNDLLPQSSPVVAGYSFAHSYRTANEVGGDYHDFNLLPDGRLGLTVGDASGHGIAAGLLMAIANATLKTAIEIDPKPHQVASLLNTTLCRTGDRRAFMTLFYGVLEPHTGDIEYVGAGHPFPLLRRADGEIVEIGEGSLPLGMRTEAELPGGRVRLEKGDLLVLYSDGLPEATDADGHAFGFDRLAGLLAEPGSPEEVHQRILAEFDRHVGDSDLNDDFTLVVVARE